MFIDINAEENIIYRKNYVAFLDVLGFKKLVKSSDKTDKKKIDQYFGIVNEAIKYLKNTGAKQNINSIIISDSIILTVQYGHNKETNLNRIRHLCVAVGLIQLHLALKNIWLRGAISSGNASFDSTKNQIVGPAYINSYLLEETSAIVPRVILDSKIINELNFASATEFIDEVNKWELGGLNFNNWGSNILFRWGHPDGKPVTSIKNDVPLFIDYLSPPIEEDAEELLQLVDNLENIMYNDTTVYDKFRWVCDYMQAITKREEKNDNLISSEPLYRLDNL
jgi:hypothetical protein